MMVPTWTASLADWSSQAVQWVTQAGLVLVALCMLVCILRVVRGPHLADRALGADTLGVVLIALVLLLCIRLDTLIFFDGVLVLSLLSFAGTVAMAQYIGGKHVRRRQREARLKEPPGRDRRD